MAFTSGRTLFGPLILQTLSIEPQKAWRNSALVHTLPACIVWLFGELQDTPGNASLKRPALTILAAAAAALACERIAR